MFQTIFVYNLIAAALLFMLNAWLWGTYSLRWQQAAALMLAFSPVMGSFLIVEAVSGLSFEVAAHTGLAFWQLLVVVPIVCLPLFGTFWLAILSLKALEPTPAKR